MTFLTQMCLRRFLFNTVVGAPHGPLPRPRPRPCPRPLPRPFPRPRSPPLPPPPCFPVGMRGGLVSRGYPLGILAGAVWVGVGSYRRSQVLGGIPSPDVKQSCTTCTRAVGCSWLRYIPVDRSMLRRPDLILVAGRIRRRASRALRGGTSAPWFR
jgi:hypothetical protein